MNHTLASSLLDDQDKRRLAEYVLAEHGESFPRCVRSYVRYLLVILMDCFDSTAELLQNDQRMDTVATVKERIADLRSRHTVELEKLYKHQGEDYLDEALDLYMQYDDAIVPEGSRRAPVPPRIKRDMEVGRLRGQLLPLHLIVVSPETHKSISFINDGQNQS